MRLCLEEYVSWFPFLKEWNFHSSGCLLQKTIPTHGYHNFHLESGELTNASRTLVWSVYFNDVEQGETENRDGRNTVIKQFIIYVHGDSAIKASDRLQDTTNTSLYYEIDSVRRSKSRQGRVLSTIINAHTFE